MASDHGGDPDVARMVCRAQDGDGTAFTNLVEIHQEGLLRFCTRLMRQSAAAQDLAQETLWHASRSLPGLEQPSRFNAWLFGIAANLAKRTWRREARWTLSLEELADEYPDVPWEALLPVSPPAEQLVEEAEQERRLLDAIVSLPAPLGRVVLLHYLQGLSYAEVATALDLSVSTVRNRLFVSRARLRRELASDFAVPPPRIIARPRRGGHVPSQRGASPMVHPGTEAGPGLVPVLVDVVKVWPQEPTPLAVRRWLEQSIYREGPDEPVSDLTALAERVAPLLTASAFHLSDGPLLVLGERDGERLLTMQIGLGEAYAIALELQGRASPRPLTLDLAQRLLTASGVEIVRVAMARREGDTFYATVTIRQPQGDSTDIDARPSDAIGLALRVGAPLYVASDLLAGPAPEGGWESVDPTARFSDGAIGAFERAEAEARAHGHWYLGTEHLLMGLAGDEDEPAARVLAAAGAGLSELRAAFTEKIGRGAGLTTPLRLAPRLRRSVAMAVAEARERGQLVGTGHLLLGLLGEENGLAVLLLRDLGLDVARLRGATRQVITADS